MSSLEPTFKKNLSSINTQHRKLVLFGLQQHTKNSYYLISGCGRDLNGESFSRHRIVTGHARLGQFKRNTIFFIQQDLG